MLERQLALCALANFCKNLCSATKIILSQQHVAKKPNQTEFVRLVVATKFCWREIFSHKFSSTHEADVAETCRYHWPTHLYTQSDLLLQHIALVGSDLKHSLYRLFSPVTAKCRASVTGNPSIVFFFVDEGF